MNKTNKERMGININYEENEITGSGLGAVYSAAFMKSMEPFGLIRFMDFIKTNNHYIKSDWDQEEADLWGKVVALANAAKTEIWICIPANASDEYIKTLAEFMFTHLDKEIKVYVEWGNEVWGFENQRNVNRRMIKERNIPTDTRSLWDTHQLWWEWQDYFHFAQRTAEIAFIFRDVFKEDHRPIDVNSRIRPVFTWQVIANSFAPMLEWLDGKTHTPVLSGEKFRNPHTYIWAVGLAPYFAEPNTAIANDVDFIHRHMLDSIEGQKSLLKTIVDNAKAAGLIGGAITYEGGPHYFGDGKTNLEHRTAAQQHPLMKDLMDYYITNCWYAIGGGMYTHFRHLGGSAWWGYWGAMDDLSPEQFEIAPKYASLKWVSSQPQETTVPRPKVKAAKIFSNPIPNHSIEDIEPKWYVGPGFIIDDKESIDGQNSLSYQSKEMAHEWSESSSPTFSLEPNKDYVFSFWHKGVAEYHVIVAGENEYSITTKSSSEWVEYLLPFNSGDSAMFRIKIRPEWSEKPDASEVWHREAWFDFFQIQENLIYNPSFEKGLEGWTHGLGWIGEHNYNVTDTHAYHGNQSLKISDTITPEGLNSTQFSLKENTNYRFVFYHKGSDCINVPIETSERLVDITTQPSDEWHKYEVEFMTKTSQTGYIKMSTVGPVSGSCIDNFMLCMCQKPKK